jgi:hypothetical protein
MKITEEFVDNVLHMTRKMYRKCTSSVPLVRPAEMVNLSVFRDTALCYNFVSHTLNFENCKKQRVNHFYQLRGPNFLLRSQDFAQLPVNKILHSYLIQQNLPLIPALNQMNPAHAVPFYVF